MLLLMLEREHLMMFLVREYRASEGRQNSRELYWSSSPFPHI
jgi:hypothetical protein